MTCAMAGGKPEDYYPSLRQPIEDKGPDGRPLVHFLKMYQAIRDRKKKRG